MLVEVEDDVVLELEVVELELEVLVDVDELVVVVVTPAIARAPLPWKLTVADTTPSTAALIERLVMRILPT